MKPVLSCFLPAFANTDDDGIHSFVVNIYSTHTLTRPRGLVPDYIWSIIKHLASGNLVSGKSSLAALSIKLSPTK